MAVLTHYKNRFTLKHNRTLFGLLSLTPIPLRSSDPVLYPTVTEPTLYNHGTSHPTSHSTSDAHCLVLRIRWPVTYLLHI